MKVVANVLLVVALVAGVIFTAQMVGLLFDPPVPTGDAPRWGYTLAWVVWLLASIIGFSLIEGIALGNDHGGDTLTEHIQWIAGQSKWMVGIIGGGVVAFFAWFAVHLFGRDSRVWTYLRRSRSTDADGDARNDEPRSLL